MINIVLHMENGNNIQLDDIISRNVTNKEYSVINKSKETNEIEEHKFKTSDIKFVTFA